MAIRARKKAPLAGVEVRQPSDSSEICSSKLGLSDPSSSSAASSPEAASSPSADSPAAASSPSSADSLPSSAAPPLRRTRYLPRLLRLHPTRTTSGRGFPDASPSASGSSSSDPSEHSSSDHPNRLRNPRTIAEKLHGKRAGTIEAFEDFLGHTAGFLGLMEPSAQSSQPSQTTLGNFISIITDEWILFHPQVASDSSEPSAQPLRHHRPSCCQSPVRRRRPRLLRLLAASS